MRITILMFAILLGCKNDCPSNPWEQDNPLSYERLYWHPEMKTIPALYWSCSGVVQVDNNNALGEADKYKGLQYHLLAQSIAGLSNRSVDEGKSEVGLWLHDHKGLWTYEASKQALDKIGVIEIGMQNAIELATRSFELKDGINTTLRDYFDGYVLTDIENNPESNIVASVASHVYNAIIVDVRDKEIFDSSGYNMAYDATKKTTQDAWIEFKDKCNNKALVIMPVQTGQLREFAIKNNLFVLNLNKKYRNPDEGQNIEIFKEILDWLEPNSPVYGWESRVGGEDRFVEPISQSGNIMIPYDWAYNTSLTSLIYTQRQPGPVKTLDPHLIDFEDNNNKYVSFYLSDGDNIQWMMNSFFDHDYYSHPDANNVKMSFGFPLDNLSMIAPDVCQSYFTKQDTNTSIVQTFGGGYNYADLYGNWKNRKLCLDGIAKSVAGHMKQYESKVLALMSMESTSSEAKEAYKAYIHANEDLLGIISIQYAPYAGGKGEIMWFTNAQGYDIPVVTVKYSIWDFGDENRELQGTPNYIAEKVNNNSSSDPFNLIAVHAWSGFTETGNTGGDIKGTGAASLCVSKLNEDCTVVNAEELIWRIRMHYRSEQTKQYLGTF